MININDRQNLHRTKDRPKGQNKGKMGGLSFTHMFTDLSTVAINKGFILVMSHLKVTDSKKPSICSAFWVFIITDFAGDYG
jgi:hypothetical protein